MMTSSRFSLAIICLLLATAVPAQDPSECTFWVNATSNEYVGGSCSGQPSPGYEVQHWEYNCVSDCGGGSTNNPFSLRLNGACRNNCHTHCLWEWGEIYYEDYSFDATGFDGKHAFLCFCGQGSPRAITRNCYPGSCGHACWEPLVISLRDNQYILTDQENGVWFDLTADGIVEHIPWTNGHSDDAFLVLDRNRNGVIDDGRELFSHVSPQPPAPPGEMQHGFLALEVFDETFNGGNEDGLISAEDRIFRHLRIWRDANHDGKTNSGELQSLPAVGLQSISLAYTDAHQHFDAFGNDFHFSAEATFANRSLPAWAVFFAAPDQASSQKYGNKDPSQISNCFERKRDPKSSQVQGALSLD